MGKSLKGKELGKGISQRRDGFYIGRFTARDGTRRQKVCQKLQECRQWLADEQYKDEMGCLESMEDPTVDELFAHWISMKENTVRYITLNGYKEGYELHISPKIGKMKARKVTTGHLQLIMADLANHGMKSSSMQGIRTIAHAIFEYAVETNVVIKNPCTHAVTASLGKQSEQRKAMTIDEQQKFLKEAARRKHGYEYRFVLQTGLRTAELSGLKWSDIDFQQKAMTIRRSMRYYSEAGEWKANDTKTNSGLREIPLTDEAIAILKSQKEKNARIKVMPIEWADTVFLDRKGCPVNQQNYNQGLYRICEKIGMRTISMHLLRHTFATRCIEGGMQPKTLQAILGHSNIGITLNLYVTATERQKRKEIDQISGYLLANEG